MFNLKEIAKKAEDIRAAEEREKQRKQEEANADILNRIDKLDLEPIAKEIAEHTEKYINSRSFHCLYIDVELLNNMVVREPFFIDETKGTENVLRFKMKIGTEGGKDISEKVYEIIFRNLSKFFADELKTEDARSRNSRTIWLR